MAKKSIIYRQKKREHLVAKWAEKRATLKADAYDPHVSAKLRWEAQRKLQQLPKDSSPVRLRNRCQITGRGRGVYRMFGLSRSVLRLHAMRGELPGIMKFSR